MPSCTTCNSFLKRDIRFSIARNINPYLESLHDNFKINIKKASKQLKGFDIKESDVEFICKTKKTQKHIDIFALKELYLAHIDYIREIVMKINDYGDEEYLESLKKYGVSDPWQFFLGNFIHQQNINDRPLAKLTTDLYEQLGIPNINSE